MPRLWKHSNEKRDALAKGWTEEDWAWEMKWRQLGYDRKMEEYYNIDREPRSPRQSSHLLHELSLGVRVDAGDFTETTKEN